jgi:hypothetical protein
MHQDGQSLAIGLQPGQQLIELQLIERQLATPAEMRANQALMNTPDLDCEQLASLLTDRGGQRQRLLIEVNVRMVVGVAIAGALGHV